MQGRNLALLSGLGLILVLMGRVVGDTVLEERNMFGGLNIYEPTALYFQNIYHLWYGGWQSTSDYPHDRIYYRTSADNSNWSPPIEVEFCCSAYLISIPCRFYHRR